MWWVEPLGALDKCRVRGGRQNCRVINRRVGQVHRRLRIRARLTLRMVSEKSDVPRGKLALIEANRLETLRFGEVARALAALDAELVIDASHRGAAVERLIDEGHARLVARVIELLRLDGWEVRPEVTFNHYGDRGSYDILAWHVATRSLLVVEVKTELPGMDRTLRPLDTKIRVASTVAREFGWHPVAVSRALVLPDTTSSRRQVARHSMVLRAALSATSRELRSWLRAPAGRIDAIWFLSAPVGSRWERSPAAVQRVRLTKTEMAARRKAPGDRAA